MKTQAAGLFLVACAMLAGGCASHEVKKSELATPVAVTATPQATVAPDSVSAVKKAEPQSVVSQDVVKESPLEKMEREAREAQLAKERQAGLEKIFFGYDSASLSEKARNTLAQNAEVLRQNKRARIRVEGNCDERGSDDYNLALGEKRAKQALQYLATMGVPAERITTISYGKEKPVATGHDEASWSKNRRDEFVLLQ